MMDIMRRSIKAYIVSMVVFVLLTFVLAAVIYFTEYKESWAFSGLVAIMSISALFFGIMEGSAVGRRGLLVGFLSAVFFVASILLFAGGVFAGKFDDISISVFYWIPVFAGMIGGILGANMKK